MGMIIISFKTYDSIGRAFLRNLKVYPKAG